MSAESDSGSKHPDQMPLDELCQEIIDDDAYPDEIQYLAAGLKEAVEEGRIDAMPN